MAGPVPASISAAIVSGTERASMNAESGRSARSVANAGTGLRIVAGTTLRIVANGGISIRVGGAPRATQSSVSQVQVRPTAWLGEKIRTSM
jgi:hypothetical protein